MALTADGRQALGAQLAEEGERFVVTLTLGAPGSFREELPGRAVYERTSDGWRVVEVWLSNDTRDYMSRVTR